MLSVLRKTRLKRCFPAKYENRTVSTLSPLATAFNCRRKEVLDFNILKQKTGLFSKSSLTNFEGFYGFKENAISTCNDLMEEVLNDDKKRGTVEIFDDLSNTLCQVADLSEFVRIAHPDPQIRSAAEDACITISGIVEKLNTHRKLYDVLKESVEKGNSGDDHVAKLFLFDFEQSGIHLEKRARAHVAKLNDSILQIGQRFMANAAAPRQLRKSQLPTDLRNYFANGDDVIITGMQVDSAEPRVREAAYRLYLTPDPVQEIILKNLLECRHDMAQLCGFSNYADRAINASTMETSENVEQFLNSLSDQLSSRAQNDFELMLKMKKAESPNSIELCCWDPPYFTQKAKKEWFNASSSEYSAYFSLGNCMEGFNLLLQSLYGISLKNVEMQPGESWAPDVHKLAVIDDGNVLLGHIYCDFYERPEKPHQDCHFTIQGGKLLDDGTYQNPIVVVMLSLSSGKWGGPALLWPGAVDNLFHELGHAIHSMLGRTKYQHVSGTRCPTDLAEVPSVLMEYFANDPRVLRLFARHFQTQEPMPEDMLQKLCASKHVFTASEMQQQVFYSMLDQRYHTIKPTEDQSTTQVLKDVQSHYYGLPYVENTAWQHRFSHLVGYGAKYYSYLISRAVAWSIWQQDFAKDPLSRSSGDHFRYGVLQYGGSKHPSDVLAPYLSSANSISPVGLASALANELDHNSDNIAKYCK